MTIGEDTVAGALRSVSDGFLCICISSFEDAYDGFPYTIL
ncbi:hypothetical protein T4B_10226 [Trichinella pseudospiralis]|uniref:Uncharacterized protein n=1 Tax=Trichinella pseudospiralis TaxID=6337 RepID=A0A0V1GC65_TRIPS|nr:hypothetical protein T4B_10226 [Trichinella pseudospiralis]